MLTPTMFFFLERIHVESGSWPIEEMLEALDLYIQIQLEGQCRLQQLQHTYMGCNGGNLRSTSTSGSPGSFKPLGGYTRHSPGKTRNFQPNLNLQSPQLMADIFRLSKYLGWIHEFPMLYFCLFVFLPPVYSRCDLFRMFLLKHDRFILPSVIDPT